MNDAVSSLTEKVRAVVQEVAASAASDGIETMMVPKDRWLAAARACSELGFGRFIDLTAIDFSGKNAADEDRFEVHLLTYSLAEKRWARLKTRTGGKLSSVVGVFAGAHNYEREAFDLMGVTFEGHPALTRIMLPDGWQGHPLRRDYEMPLEPVDFTVTRDLYDT